MGHALFRSCFLPEAAPAVEAVVAAVVSMIRESAGRDLLMLPALPVVGGGGREGGAGGEVEDCIGRRGG